MDLTGLDAGDGVSLPGRGGQQPGDDRWARSDVHDGDAAAPTVDSESSAGNVTAASATLNAEINPNFADTTYYFEYVDAADYNPAAPDPYSAGAQVPLPPGTDVGSGNTIKPPRSA